MRIASGRPGSASGRIRAVVLEQPVAHDLLAPLVQQRFRLSLAPGQRARRLLENRAPEWHDGKTGAVLDGADLRSRVLSLGIASRVRLW